MFGDELIIGSIRAQSNRLKGLILQLEAEETLKTNGSYYARELHEIERALKAIRKKVIEPTYSGSCH